MTRWPGLEAYNAALAEGSSKLLPSYLAGAQAALNLWGVPNALSGGFAFIYELTLPSGERRALRLFHTGREERVAALREAYRSVEALRRSSSPLKRYFVEARWEDACVFADGRAVPGIVMDWVEAPTLGVWLERNHDDPASLRGLRKKLAELQCALEEAGVVHGDMQTGNIAIREDLSPVLLDYDGFRLAASESSAAEEGHVHFRHPDPAGHGPTADRFPFLSMDLGLQALAADPSLFARFSQGENVLFCGDDYRDPETSAAFAALSIRGGMGKAAEYFAALCRGSASAVPTILRFRAAAGMDGAEAAPQPQEASSSAPFPAIPPVPGSAYLGQYPVLDPSAFSAMEAAVGSKVELVGRIVSIKESYTKYGKPYVFANFGDWRRNGTKLIWWSEGLEAFGDRAPDEDWEGRWVSVTGLVDAPYRNARFGTVQFSLTVLDPSQLRFLGAEEAARRLGHSAQGPQTSAPSPGRPGRGSAGPMSNAELLSSLRTAPSRTGARPSSAPSGPVPKLSQPPADSRGCLPLLIWGGIAAFLFFWIATR